MDIISLIRVAGEALLRNKSRSFLTILGIVIGVAAVILLVSIGQGLRQYIAGQFESLGSNLVIVLPVNLVDEQGHPATFSGGPPVGGKVFSEKDLRKIRTLDPAISHVIPQSQKRLRMKTTNYQGVIEVVGSSKDYMTIRSVTMMTGRFFDSADVDRYKKIAVLGPTAAKKLFPTGSYLDKEIVISSVPFKVIGMTNIRGSGGSLGDLDDQIYIPITSLQRLVDSEGTDFIVVKVTDQAKIPDVIDTIKKYLEKQRKPDTFSVVDQRQILGTVQSIIGVLTMALTGIAAISLFVGGIGIMNMMLVTVTERTREIGLRKALGATRRVILGQFLAESVLLSLAGGITGVLIGAGGSLIINRFFPARVSGTAVLLAFGVSAGVGIIFGILPARRAAKMTAVEALRYE